MEKTKELPTHPGQMPLEVGRDMSWLRSAFYDIQSMADDVEITFEAADHHDCVCEDSEGEWNVSASKRGKRFAAKHERIENALWYVLQHLTAKDRTDFENWERKKREALSKLTEDDKRILHLR